MMELRGHYYDGKSSMRRTVILTRDGNDLVLSGEGVEKRFPVDSVKVSPPLGNVRRTVRFTDGALCEILDDRHFGKVLGDSRQPIQRFISRWERNLPMVLAALVLTIAAIAGFIKYGVPLLTKQVVQAIPQASEVQLGKESLEFLDKHLMEPSRLPSDRRQRIASLFSEMKKKLPRAQHYHLEFRASKAIGANAFALPGGIIVVTDGMVELARNDEELEGVLAHEAGHQHARHALRHVLQSTGSGLLIAAVTGDITSITTLSATLPTTLVNAGYSREFENEADDAAVAYLTAQGIHPRVYAGMLARLQADHDKKAGGTGNRVWTPADLFATHPSTSERMRRVLGLEK
ncbi:M48 family metallopeptidase [Geotalea sp. SG265]|uniref:M48 family metallopeptidase n=1 Tax=Geotalea sp. SG265 TaxID=2922867 RepID=UPI001FB04467|nr:M48 family metallopeptidase [Geotalea sp. SG265]